MKLLVSHSEWDRHIWEVETVLEDDGEEYLMDTDVWIIIWEHKKSNGSL